MGFFKGMKGSASPDGGGGGGNGLLAKLFSEHASELQGGGDKAKYTYDANTQQYNTASAPTDGTPAPAQMKKGGTASSRADGCCVKGKTKGRMI